MNPNSVLESLDREITFYRRRAGQVFFFSLLIEALILCGREQIDLLKAGQYQSAVLYTMFYVAVAAAGIFLGTEYRHRLHILKERRVSLLEKNEFNATFPLGKDQRLSEIQVLYVVLIFLSSSGISLVWLNATGFEPIGWIMPVLTVVGLVAAIIRARKNKRKAPDLELKY